MAVVGDIHGAIDPLCAATGWLEEHWDGPVVFVGDYVNRGPDSYRVMEAMVQLAKSWGERLTLLMGNHDLSLLRFVAEGDRPMFLAHGGLRTVSSYLRELSIPLDQHPLEAFVEVFPESHRQLLEGMQLAWENSEVLVTHAGFNPISPDSRSIDDIVLGRHPALFSESLRTPRPLVVCGHYVQRTGRPYVSDQFICLDSGCGSEISGPLSVLILPDRRILRFREDES